MHINSVCKKTGRPALLEDSDQYSDERELRCGSPWVCLTKARQKEMTVAQLVSSVMLKTSGADKRQLPLDFWRCLRHRPRSLDPSRQDLHGGDLRPN